MAEDFENLTDDRRVRVIEDFGKVLELTSGMGLMFPVSAEVLPHAKPLIKKCLLWALSSPTCLDKKDLLRTGLMELEGYLDDAHEAGICKEANELITPFYQEMQSLQKANKIKSWLKENPVKAKKFLTLLGEGRGAVAQAQEIQKQVTTRKLALFEQLRETDSEP